MINRWVFVHLPKPRQVLTRLSYEYISILDKDTNSTFMNYGYAHLDPNNGKLELSAKEEKYRYSIQLYHHMASFVVWRGLDALEVSSGRGGGACYIMQHFCPNSLIGVDFSTKAVCFCNDSYSIKGLSFMQDDAESLHFPSNSFDIIINLEASFYYPNVERFFNNVVRILKPSGYFLYADMRYVEDVEVWQAQLRNTGLKLLYEEDITPNVIRALALDKNRRRNLVDQYVPKLLHKPFYNFAGVTGARLACGQPKIGERIYKFFVLQKRDVGLVDDG